MPTSDRKDADERYTGSGAVTLGGPPDSALVEAARAGDRGAYGQLWARHAPAGVAYARALTNTFDPDDLVSESFEKILRAITAGGGPTGAFRSYLYITIKNTAYSWQRSRRELHPLGEQQEEIADERSVALLDALEGAPSVYAFNSLPPAWQEVLWYVDVEGMAASEVAVLIGSTPGAVAMRTHRAREGLRQAWIQVQLDAVADGSDHQWVLERMGTFVRGGLARRDSKRVLAHLDECTRCALVHSEAKQISSRLALVLVPAVTGLTGTALAGWLTSHQAPSSAAAAQDPYAQDSAVRTRTRRVAYAAGGAAVLTVAAVLGWHAIVSPPETPAASTTTRQPESRTTPAPTTQVPAPTTLADPPPTTSPTPPQGSPAPDGPSVAPAPLLLGVPAILSPTDGALTNATRLELSGTGTPGTTISISTDGIQIGQAIADGAGSWAATADISTLEDGTHNVTVTSTHTGSTATRAVRSIVVDRHITIPSQLIATTSSAGTVIAGIADPGSSIQVRGVNTIATATTDATGHWSTIPVTTFPSGYSTVTATASDAAGNVSPPSAPLGIQG